MASHAPNDLLLRITGWLTWLDSIDAGPHPMDPQMLAALRKFFAANAIGDLAGHAPQPDLARRYSALGRRLLLEAARDLQAAVSDDDDSDPDKWHPFIPKWGGGPVFEPASPSAGKWLSHLSRDVTGSLLAGAVTTIEQGFAQKQTARL